MIRLRIKDILKEQNRTKYWLYKNLDYSYENMNRIVENKTKQIRFETIEKICKILNCSAGDLFEILEDGDDSET